MSGLSALCEYQSDSEESSSEGEIRSKLPVPDLSKVTVVATEVHIDDPQLHGGRQRSFPHVRGNWATYVYVKYPVERNLNEFLIKLEEVLPTCDKSWEKSTDIHISLSKTVTLQFHQIVPFTKSVQEIVGEEESFELQFSGFKVYTNDEKTRTFIALEVDHYSQRHLISFTEKIDGILREYRLPTFYEDPSFHMSVFWINGDRKSDVENNLEELNYIFSTKLNKLLTTGIVDRVYCKSGNKYFQYFLK